MYAAGAPARSELILYSRHFFFVVDLGVFERFGSERLRLGMPKLRAVKDGEKPQKQLTVTQAAALNDHREMLIALRVVSLGRLRHLQLTLSPLLLCLGSLC